MTHDTSPMAELTQAITRMGSSQFPINIDLWDATRVADYLKISKSRFLNHYSIQPGFPKPGRLPSPRGAGRALWRARDVVEWANNIVFEHEATVKPPRQNHAKTS